MRDPEHSDSQRQKVEGWLREGEMELLNGDRIAVFAR